MTARDSELYLQEELLLLLLRDEKGTVDHRAGMYQFTLGGALLAELLLAERVTIADEKRRFVNVVDPAPLGEPVLDDCLARLRDAKRRAKAETWVARFANLRRLRHRVAAGLCRRGVLHETEDRILWIFTRRRYPERDHRHEQRIISRLDRAIFSDTQQVDARTAALVALADSGHLLPIVFEKKRLRERRARIKAVTAGDYSSRAVRAAVQAARAAAQAAMAAAVIAATAASTS